MGTARTGRLIDRFRDRLGLPIQTDQDIVGFIARRNPHTDDAGAGSGPVGAGPKYLNTADNTVFSKSAQLFGIVEGARALAAGATPVLVEGPIDATAVTLATDDVAVGVAPLGTAFTDRLTDTLRRYARPGGPGVIVATDNDPAGRQAAEPAYWQLAARGADLRHAQLPDGLDPAELLTTGGPQALRDALASAPPLARALVQARIDVWRHRLVVTEDGRERSADELRQLLRGAGLSTQDVRVTATGTAVISATVGRPRGSQKTRCTARFCR